MMYKNDEIVLSLLGFIIIVSVSPCVILMVATTLLCNVYRKTPSLLAQHMIRCTTVKVSMCCRGRLVACFVLLRKNFIGNI